RNDFHGVTTQSALHGELHLAVDQRVQRVVLAAADVDTLVELGAALANDDRARRDGLATVGLDAQHLRLGIATVARRAAAFLLCHGDLLLKRACRRRARRSAS